MAPLGEDSPHGETMKISITKTLAAFAAMTCLGLSAGSASAALLECSTGPVTYKLGDATQSYCSGGNDTNTIGAGYDLFGTDSWILADKLEFDDNGVLQPKGTPPEGDQKVTFESILMSGGTLGGTWQIDANAFSVASQIVLTLKQGPTFAAFLLADGVTSGTWSTSGPGGSSMGLSHGSLYYLPGSVTSIPLPGALPSLFAALGGLVLLGRKRRAPEVGA